MGDHLQRRRHLGALAGEDVGGEGGEVAAGPGRRCDALDAGDGQQKSPWTTNVQVRTEELHEDGGCQSMRSRLSRMAYQRRWGSSRVHAEGAVGGFQRVRHGVDVEGVEGVRKAAGLAARISSRFRVRASVIYHLRSRFRLRLAAGAVASIPRRGRWRYAGTGSHAISSIFAGRRGVERRPREAGQ